MVESLLDRMPLNNGYTIPGLGIGTANMVGYECEKAVFSAIMKGYRLIDTADMYDNEADVGRAVNRAVSAGISRDEIFVVTKIAPQNAGFESAVQGFDRSLERLNLQYVDLLLIHKPDKDDEVNSETWRALEDIYASGRAQSVGVSNFIRGDLVPLLKKAKVNPAVNQYEIYPGHMDDDTNDFCDSENIISMAYSPIKKGKISNEKKVVRVAEKYGKTPAQIALRWNVQRGIIPIPKSKSKDRIQENCEIFDFSLTDEDMDILNGLGVPRNQKNRVDDSMAENSKQRVNRVKGRGRFR